MTRGDDPRYSERLDLALVFTAEVFRTHYRKGSGVPYLGHLLAVAAIVADHGGDEDQIIAALLHDYLEDVEGSAESALVQRFGPRVAHMVLSLSDTTTRPKPPWEERKRAYVAKLAGEPPELKLICAADKLHNASAILRDHREKGSAVWERFTASREQTLWYYRAVLAALGTGWSHPVLDELAAAVERLHALADESR